jgi:hypothetical protein
VPASSSPAAAANGLAGVEAAACDFARSRYTARMRKLPCVAFVPLALALAASARLETPFLEKSQSCLQRLQTILAEAEQLRETTAANTPAIAECLDTHIAKIKTVAELARLSHEQLLRALAVTNMPAVQSRLANITNACARAERVLAEARQCPQTAPTLKSAPIHNTPAAGPPSSPARQPARTRSNCIRHDQLACLLTRAMELSVEPEITVDPCIAALTQRGIEPLAGWQPARCATVDDFCVAVARALNLNVDNANDPASYRQALRDEGLPVDTLLPQSRGPEAPVYLLEREVRAFLATAHAAPLRSNRPIIPD